MLDCPRDDIRDLLPDLVHDQLGATERARAEQHIAGCAECAAELELLRTLRATAFSAPEVDADRIAATVRSAMADHGGELPDVPADDGAVPISSARSRPGRESDGAPAPGTSRRTAVPRARHPIPQSWRVAAAIALVAAGVGSYALARGGSPVRDRPAEQSKIAAAPSSAPSTEATTQRAGAAAGAPAAAASTAGAAGSGADAATLSTGSPILGDAVNELSESDMQALLQSVDELQAMPELEPHQLPTLASVVEGAL